MKRFTNNEQRCHRITGRILTAVASVFWFFLPLAALAQVGSLDGIVGGIASPLPILPSFPITLAFNCFSGDGACGFALLLIYLVERSRLAVAATAVLIAVVAGLRMIMSQSEETQTAGKRALAYTATGIFVIFLVGPIVRALYGGIGADPGSVLSGPGDVVTATNVIRTEIWGVIRFLETAVGIIAVTMLIIQGLRIVLSFGSQNAIQQSYKGVLIILGGMLLIALDRVLLQIFDIDPAAIGIPGLGIWTTGGAPTTAPLFFQIFGFVRFILTLVAIVLIGIIIYAGLLMILHYGNDELVRKAKTAIINGLLGLGIVMVSFAIVTTLILGI